jgi:hypothetical protein
VTLDDALTLDLRPAFSILHLNLQTLGSAGTPVMQKSSSDDLPNDKVPTGSLSPEMAR